MRKLLYGTAVLLLIATTVFADSINSANSRPVTIGTSSETPLQTLLDKIYGTDTNGTGIVNAKTDQQKDGVWQLPGPGTRVTAPVLQFEFAGNAPSNIFGIWSGHDTTGPITKVPIFTGAASGNSGATLKWLAESPDSFEIFAAGGGGVNVGTFTGIDRYWFGFYLEGPGGTFFTADQLNQGGSPQALSYVGPGDLRTFAFEDQAYAGTDRDYNDMVVSTESLTPVPDGGMTLMLLGGVLVGLGALRRKFRA